MPRRPVVEGLVGPQGVVGAAEQAEFDSEGVAIADDRAVEVLVFQGAEEPFDHAVGLRAPDSGADVTKQRVVAGERLGEGAAAEAGAVEFLTDVKPLWWS
jgi:hypothetical protein